MLEPIKGIEFFEEKHYYKVFGKFIPSVSSILKPISNQIYGTIDEAILRKAANRGTEIHMAIEVYDISGAEIVSDEYRKYFEAYKVFLEEHPFLEVVANEYRVYEPTLWYAGTVDKIYRNKITNNLILADFKTSAALEIALISPQLTGYDRALRAHGIEIFEDWAIHLKADGTYKKITIKQTMDVFVSCLAIQNHVKKHKKGA